MARLSGDQEQDRMGKRRHGEGYGPWGGGGQLPTEACWGKVVWKLYAQIWLTPTFCHPLLGQTLPAALPLVTARRTEEVLGKDEIQGLNLDTTIGFSLLLLCPTTYPLAASPITVESGS